MTDRLTIAIAQPNPTVGKLNSNMALLLRQRAEAHRAGADLVVYSELCVSGYPPEDLVLKPDFVTKCMAATQELAVATGDGGPAMLIGAPWRGDDGEIYNAALLLDGGKIAQIRTKVDLPNYAVFDEKRVFTAGPMPGPMPFRGVRLGVMVCEDMWTPDVTECLEESGAELLIVPNGSPFTHHKLDQRQQLAIGRITESGLPLIYVNQVGGQDELVFDGASFVMDADCGLQVQLPAFKEALSLTRWARFDDGRWRVEPGERVPPPEGLEEIYQAMVLGLRDYVRKNGFPGVILGLSGGIDSALSAAVAVDALGPDQVRCVMMPSPYTSDDSLDDAAAIATLLGVRYDIVNIGPAMHAFDEMLDPVFDGRAPDITEENLQSRARGMTLMALSNKLGPMVLSTGNKSEMSVGYATLYGDMCGGYSVLKDVYKTTVFALSRWRNTHRPDGFLGPPGRVMPDRVITKPPTAELRPDQKDEDSLPPYETLDAILNGLVEEERSVDDLTEAGHDRDTVNRVWRLLDRAEYKRRQAPPGVKITSKAFGKDRRYPITNGFLSLL